MTSFQVQAAMFCIYLSCQGWQDPIVEGIMLRLPIFTPKYYNNLGLTTSQCCTFDTGTDDAIVQDGISLNRPDFFPHPTEVMPPGNWAPRRVLDSSDLKMFYNMLPRWVTDTAFFDGEKNQYKGRFSTSSERFREQTDLNKAWCYSWCFGTVVFITTWNMGNCSSTKLEMFSISTGIRHISETYCWWKKILHQLKLVVYPIFYKVLYIPRGCLGFLPSTVSTVVRPWGRSFRASYWYWVHGSSTVSSWMEGLQHTRIYMGMGVSKNRGYPKMDGLWWKTLIKMDDLGVPLFLETPIYVNK